MRPWTITQLEAAFRGQDLPLCRSPHEESMARAIHGREVRELAERIQQSRKLTPGEVAIAEQYGFRA